MEQKPFKEILIFVLGTTPQIVTETLYCLTQSLKPPVFPDEIHILTTTSGKEGIEKELLEKGRLAAFSKEFGLPPVPLTPESIHLVCDEAGRPLDDIREISHNESLGDFIANFIRGKTADPSARLHCSLAGGRKTMSFYLGSALQLFGRPWDKLYHVLVNPEFESHPEFFYKPKKNKVLDVRDANGRLVKRLRTRDAEITLAELPFVRLRDKISLDGKGFKDLIRESQREIDLASIQPTLRIDLSEKVLYIGEVGIDMVPIQLALYLNLLKRKVEGCHFPARPYCYDCVECFPFLADLASRKTFEEILKDYQRSYGPHSGRVVEFRRHWEKRGGIDPDTLRQNISKINAALREGLKEELLPYFTISAVGKHGSKRYGIRVEKGKIKIED
ncbi:MAG: CRISPR-associated ring nuclease Csm6 [Desulfobacterota bacterium]|nr:CRISPR-associated ring nuclease Csm6 [Thermodesulfobacteriota bacterium]